MRARSKDRMFVAALIALLTVALVGDRVSSASHAVAREPIRLGVIGIVGFFALCFVCLLLGILSIVLIGIPFLLALIFGWWLAYIFGIVAVFQTIGGRVMRLLGRPEASQIAIVLAGGLVLGILRYFPIFGGLLWAVSALIGLGAVFATRFGRGRPWLRHAAPAGQAYSGSPPPAATPVESGEAAAAEAGGYVEGSQEQQADLASESEAFDGDSEPQAEGPDEGEDSDEFA